MHRVRFLAESKLPLRNITDALTGQRIFWWRGSDVRFEIAVTDNGQHLLAGDIGTLIVEVKNLTAGPSDAAVMRKEFGEADCDATFTAADWNGGVKALLFADFTDAEAALAPGHYRIIVRHEDPAGLKNTYCSSEIEVIEDHSESSSLAAPPTPGSEYWNKTEADGRFALASEVVGKAPATFLFAADYGVVADGTTDDTAALQAAFNALRDSNTFTELVLPIGVMVISSALVLRVKYGCRVRGFGPERTIIRQTSSSANGIQYRYLTGQATNFIEFLQLADFALESVGIATATGIGLMMHDDTLSSEFFNGGSLRIDNVKIGNNGKGFGTGLYLKRWDTSTISHSRFLYNYTNVYCEAFTKTVTFYGCGNSQAESLLWHIGTSAKVNLIGCDNGNCPQWIRADYGSSVTIIGNNFETQRFSSTAARRHNVSASVYPTVSTVSGINTTTGLITTSAAHGYKPGNLVHFGYATIPTGLAVAELYEILADGFTATTFKVAPVFRAGSVTSGSPNITVSGTRTDTNDLTVGGKVFLTTGTTLGAFTAGEYWIVGKPTSSTLTVSATEGGTPINFPANGTVGVRPTTGLLPSTEGASVTVFCPAFALSHSALCNTMDALFLARGDGTVTNPIASLGTGAAFYSSGVWQTAAFSGTWAGRVLVLGLNAMVAGQNLPVTQKLSTDALALPHTTGTTVVENEASGFAANSTRRGNLLALMTREGIAGNDRLFWQCRDRFGAFTNEPILNRDARITTSIASGTAGTPFELKPNVRYRVDFAAAAADVVLNLPDDSTTGEVLAVDDEIEIFNVNSNSQSVKITQVGTQTIRNGSTLTTSGAGFGLTLGTGAMVRLKCVAVAGVGNWQVIQSVGTIGTF